MVEFTNVSDVKMKVINRNGRSSVSFVVSPSAVFQKTAQRIHFIGKSCQKRNDVSEDVT